MMHNAMFEIAHNEIKNDEDFACSIKEIVLHALHRFKKEVRQPMFDRVSYGSVRIICGFSVERGTYCVKVEAESPERALQTCKDCKKRFTKECRFYMAMIETSDDFFCADGKPKGGTNNEL